MNGASASTVTATTATAERPRGYTGRFAPSPTGPLHLGSLTTALASCLEARVHGGHWLLRIEDVDTTRAIPGVGAGFLRTLESLGFCWDGPVIWQSARTARYAEAVRQLRANGRAYPCACTRRQLAAESEPGSGYPGTCRDGPQGPPPYAWRFRMDDRADIAFDDLLVGHCEPPRASLGDPIIVRRDGLHAYQLAVVVDDADAGVTHVVRGRDLLESTPWQLQLQSALALPHSCYAHLPLVTNANGSKLSKSAHTIPVVPENAGDLLYKALILLKQNPPPVLAGAGVAELWSWARQHWQLNLLRGVGQLTPQ